MPELDLIVRNARVVTASDEFSADIGIARGVITHPAQRHVSGFRAARASSLPRTAS